MKDKNSPNAMFPYHYYDDNHRHHRHYRHHHSTIRTLELIHVYKEMYSVRSTDLVPEQTQYIENIPLSVPFITTLRRCLPQGKDNIRFLSI